MWTLHNIKNYLRLYREWHDPRFSAQDSSNMIFVNKLSNIFYFYHVIFKNAFRTEKRHLITILNQLNVVIVMPVVICDGWIEIEKLHKKRVHDKINFGHAIATHRGWFVNTHTHKPLQTTEGMRFCFNTYMNEVTLDFMWQHDRRGSLDNTPFAQLFACHMFGYTKSGNCYLGP